MGHETVLHPGKHRAINLYKNAPEVTCLAPEGESLLIQFQNTEGVNCGSPVMISSSADPERLNHLLNTLLENEEKLEYSFYVEQKLIVNDLHNDVIQTLKKTVESVVTIQYVPQALFHVKPVTRCSSTVSGHRDAILIVSFSPNGHSLATGSGDCTVRIWDIFTGTQRNVLMGHNNWVQSVSWSPDCELLASGDMSSKVCVWRSKDGTLIFSSSKHHSDSITSISWEPWHLKESCSRFVTSSRDGSVILWDAIAKTPLKFFSKHNSAVMNVRWSGQGYIYSASRDRNIRIYDPESGLLQKTLEGHGHWVNFLALNTDSVLKNGPYAHDKRAFKDKSEAFEESKKKYENFMKNNENKELMVSCSDDRSMMLWNPSISKKPIARMVGHNNTITHVCYSNDGLYIASASFDKSVKLWNGKTGEFISSFFGHVSPVFQVTWSPDSRYILSGSQDSTLKLWSVQKRNLNMDLPGHEDSVYSVDWNATGEYVASGGKDRKLKIWRH